MRIRLLLADDHAIVLKGLVRCLEGNEFEVVGAVRDGRALVDAAAELQPDLIITDIGMPILNGIDAARQICAHNPKAKIIFFSMHFELSYAVEAMKAGGRGYLRKNAEVSELIAAIRKVLDDEIYITPSLSEPVMNALLERKNSMNTGLLTHRQREVLQLIAEGRPPKEIAVILGISERTVEFHKYRIMEILGLHSVPELAVYAARMGIVF